MNYHTHRTFYDQSQHTGAGIFNKPYDPLIVFQYDNEHGLQLVRTSSPCVDSEQAHTLLGLAP